MKKCGECVNFHACELWNIGDMENTNADHCTLYETVRDTAAYYLGLCDAKMTGWTPVTESLPNKEGNYLVTAEKYNGGRVIEVSSYHDNGMCFYWGIETSPIYKVLAWTNLPPMWEE